MRRPSLRPAGMALALAALAAPVVAQGSSVYTQSACVSGRGHTAIAGPCVDASGVYYNPAALALMPSAVSAGFTGIHNVGMFTYDVTGVQVDREATTPIVPHIYGSFRFGGGDRLASGFGFWAPYGLGIEWPQDFEGRFVSWKTELTGIYLQPTIAYQLIPGRLAVGGGPQVVLGGIELNQRLDAGMVLFGQPGLPTFPLGTDLAAATLSGSGTGFGGHIGLYYDHDGRLSVGARYMHSVPVDLSGDAAFDQISITGIPDAAFAELFAGPLADRPVAASLTFPPQAVIGLRFGATPRLGLLGEYQWTGWSTFDEIRTDLVFAPGEEPLTLALEYNDAHTFRLGGEYLASPEVVLRAGFVYSTAATPDQTVTPILPEAERHLFTLGAGYRFGSIQADAFYNFVNQANRRGRVRSELPDGSTGAALNVGVYGSNAHLFGLTLSYVFDVFGFAR